MFSWRRVESPGQSSSLSNCVDIAFGCAKSFRPVLLAISESGEWADQLYAAFKSVDRSSFEQNDAGLSRSLAKCGVSAFEWPPTVSILDWVIISVTGTNPGSWKVQDTSLSSLLGFIRCGNECLCTFWFGSVWSMCGCCGQYHVHSPSTDTRMDRWLFVRAASALRSLVQSAVRKIPKYCQLDNWASGGSYPVQRFDGTACGVDRSLVAHQRRVLEWHPRAGCATERVHVTQSSFDHAESSCLEWQVFGRCRSNWCGCGSGTWSVRTNIIDGVITHVFQCRLCTFAAHVSGGTFSSKINSALGSNIPTESATISWRLYSGSCVEWDCSRESIWRHNAGQSLSPRNHQKLARRARRLACHTDSLVNRKCSQVQRHGDKDTVAAWFNIIGVRWRLHSIAHRRSCGYLHAGSQSPSFTSLQQCSGVYGILIFAVNISVVN